MKKVLVLIGAIVLFASCDKDKDKNCNCGTYQTQANLQGHRMIKIKSDCGGDKWIAVDSTTFEKYKEWDDSTIEYKPEICL